MTVFNVVGDKPYSDIILWADTINFAESSKLILMPSKDYPGPRTLTIIANRININENAQITYDLDNQPGIDPETPAKSQTNPVSDGVDGASPLGEGSYPDADDGDFGTRGERGLDGDNGFDAPTLEIFVNEAVGSKLHINFKGQDGGRGGNGGTGGDGGNGQKGAKTITDSNWVGQKECKQEPGHGGYGGDGGDAGYPGKGGRGGNGGIVTVFAGKNSLAFVETWDCNRKPGRGGSHGNPGQPGKKGIGGLQGDSEDPCPVRAEYKGGDGGSGRTMDQIDPDWKRNFTGEDGKDGSYVCYELTAIPK